MRFVFIANNPDISFGKQAEILENELRNKGHVVVHIDHMTSPVVKKNIINNVKPEVVVVWTFFHDIGHPTMSVNELQKTRDFMVIGFEVSDTTRLSDKAIELVKGLNPDILLTPSRWSAMGFHDIDIPVAVLPHALDNEVYNILRKGKYIVIPSLENVMNKVYIYASHSKDRKGTDIALYLSLIHI